MNNKIRNFVIIAHIDHGKSTLADRMLEITGTVSSRNMREQYLDLLELERERGITIKMAPVRMVYKVRDIGNVGGEQIQQAKRSDSSNSSNKFILNLIDTPGHSDFSYEVSRALKAVEGAVLLVDAGQGIQAQTLANLKSAKNAGLTIIGALNKVDLNPDGVDRLAEDLAKLINAKPEDIHRISAKTGDGVEKLLNAVIEKIPAPQEIAERAALIFSSLYDDHKGIIAFVRVFGGSFKCGDSAKLHALDKTLKVKEVGYFTPQLSVFDTLDVGEIGYIATGLKDTDAIRIGDTIGEKSLPGFLVPNPVVFVTIYPHDANDYEDFKTSLYKLRLDDSSIEITPDTSPVLGRGFKCGFLGRLHFEIVMQRLEREFGQEIVNSFPSVAYKVKIASGEEITVENAKEFPNEYVGVTEPYTKLTIITPGTYLSSVLNLKRLFRFGEIKTHTSGDSMVISTVMPLADIVLDFDDKLKSVSQGFASFSYEFSGYRDAEVKKIDIYIASELVSGLSRIVPKDDVQREARKMAKKLKELLPRAQFAQAIQVKVGGDIIARETISPLRKNVTGDLYGGDRTRKDKLLKKQQKGKKRLKERGRVDIPPDVFRELLKR